jgi:hypothetical protein
VHTGYRPLIGHLSVTQRTHRKPDHDHPTNRQRATPLEPLQCLARRRRGDYVGLLTYLLFLLAQGSRWCAIDADRSLSLSALIRVHTAPAGGCRCPRPIFSPDGHTTPCGAQGALFTGQKIVPSEIVSQVELFCL